MTRDGPMPRTPGVSYEPDHHVDVLDFAADYALDAAESGVDPFKVAAALRDAADEIELQARENNIDGYVARSEPADFGGGESTGVQDL